MDVVGEIVHHEGSVSHLRYVVKWYGFCGADDTAAPPRHIPQHFIDAYRRRFDKPKRKTVSWKPLKPSSPPTLTPTHHCPLDSLNLLAAIDA